MQIFAYLLFKTSQFTIGSFETISTVFEVQKNYRIVPKIRVDFEKYIRYD